MQIATIKIKDLKPAAYNPRRKSEHVLQTVRQSLRDYGFLQPVIFNTHNCPDCGDRNMVIVGGHRRLEAAAAEGFKEVPAIAVNLHLEDEKRANLRLNAQEKFKQNELAQLISELHTLDADSVKSIGFSANEIINYLFQARYSGNKLSGILQEKFLVPPFSVFDSKQGYWQKRKQQWLDLLGDLAETRENRLAGSENNLLMRGINSGVSIFDPVVSELMFLWFLPKGGRVLDPFAGSLGRGGVAAVMSVPYTGIEIRQEQIDTNLKRLQELEISANYIRADSKNLNKVIPADDQYDLLFTCPPYYDLEVYSTDEKDLSMKQTYEEFMHDYENIFRQAAEHIKDNRFAVIVLGDIRDDEGFYRNFLSDNIALFHRLGFKLYNEIIYVQMLATAPHRAERNMKKRKVVKTHQNIYTFYKGDPELLKNPSLLEVHNKVLTFFKGNPETISDNFKNPPQIDRDIMATGEPEQ